METQTPDIPERYSLPLPGCMATVLLPLPPNFLHVTHGTGTMPIDQISAGDATLLGLAMARQTIHHWRRRSIQAASLSHDEAELFDVAPLLHVGLLQRIARQVATANGSSWTALTSETQAECVHLVHVTLSEFLEEIHRGQ